MTQIKVVLPAPRAPDDIITGQGARLFIGGVEVENIEALSFATALSPDGLAKTTLVVALFGVVELEFVGK